MQIVKTAKGEDKLKDARFTFANAARGPNQTGFETHDPDLLKVFELIFTEKLDDSKDIPEPAWLTYLKRNGNGTLEDRTLPTMKLLPVASAAAK